MILLPELLMVLLILLLDIFLALSAVEDLRVFFEGLEQVFDHDIIVAGLDILGYYVCGFLVDDVFLYGHLDSLQLQLT